MLGKLLKYEFRATRRLQLSVFFGMLLASLAGFALSVALNDIHLIPALEEKAFGAYLSLTVIGWILLVVLDIVAFSGTVISLVLLLSRFYKNLFSDEGYLTFTLPVSPHSIIWSKLICAIVWTFAMLVAAIVAACSAFCTVTITSGMSFSEIGTALDELAVFYSETIVALFSYLFGKSDTVLFCIEGIMLLLVSPFMQFLIYYLAITLGSSLAKKNKILVSIGIYLLINTVVGWIISLSSIVPSLLLTGLDEFHPIFVHIGLIVPLVAEIAAGLVSYLWIEKIITKKLNLD